MSDDLSLKRCGACGEEKPLTDFYLQSTNPNHRAYGRPQGRCKLCVRSQTGAYQRKNRVRASELQRRWNLAKKYGITVEEYDRLFREQNGLCALCLGPPRGRGKVLVVDHCHDTGRVRGLLCGPCNRGIGYLGDSPDLVRVAIRYLEAALRGSSQP